MLWEIILIDWDLPSLIDFLSATIARSRISWGVWIFCISTAFLNLVVTLGRRAKAFAHALIPAQILARALPLALVFVFVPSRFISTAFPNLVVTRGSGCARTGCERGCAARAGSGGAGSTRAGSAAALGYLNWAVDKRLASLLEHSGHVLGSSRNAWIS